MKVVWPIIVPYWFACCVLMATRGIHVTITRKVRP